MSENNGNYKVDTEHRITKLEGLVKSGFESVHESIKNLKENHLAHLQEDITKLHKHHDSDMKEVRRDYKKMLWWIVGTGAGAGVGVPTLKAIFDILMK